MIQGHHGVDVMRRHLSGLGGTGRLAAAILALGIVSSCALVKPQSSPRETYDLSAPQTISGVRGGTRAQILVKLPTSLKSIDSDRLIVKPSPAVVTYLGGAQWTDNVPKLVQAKLVESFENSAATGATAKPGDGLVIDYQLVSDLRKFEISTDGPAVALIEMSIKLLADKSGLVRETRIFRARANVVGSGAAAYVAAIDAAFDEMATDIVQWVARRT